MIEHLFRSNVYHFEVSAYTALENLCGPNRSIAVSLLYLCLLSHDNHSMEKGAVGANYDLVTK